jgi:RNA polymerase sigma-70 factor (ECF subfamily)
MNGFTRQMQALVEKVQQGDANAFGEIYDLLLERVYRFIYFRTGNKEDAEDLTETVFIKIWKSIPSYENKGLPFEAWVFRIARNIVIDHYRTKKPKVTLNENLKDTLPDNKETPEELLHSKMLKETIFNKIRLLPEAYKEIIILKFIEDKDNKEISDILEKPIDQVRVLQSRALKALKKLIYETN